MAQRSCPQCAKELTALQSGDVRGDACHECGGIWLSIDVSKRIGRALDRTSIDLGEKASALATEPFPKHGEAPPCPDCGKAMRCLVVPTTTIEVDTCILHGTWMDRGELETMVRALAASRLADGKPPPGVKADDALWRLNVAYGGEPPPMSSNDAANAALGTAESAVLSMAIEVGFSLLGALLSKDGRT